MILSMIFYVLALAFVREHYYIFLYLTIGTLILFYKSQVPIFIIVVIMILMMLSSFYKISFTEGEQFLEGTVISVDLKDNETFYFIVEGTNRKLLIDEYVEPINDGDEISVFGRVEKIERKPQMAVFNTGAYLAAKNIFFTLDIEKFELIESNGPTLKYKILTNLRDRLIRKFGDSGNLIFTMFFGIKETLDKNTKNIFTLFGLSHLLVVSGLHVSIIAQSIDSLLMRIRIFYFIRKTIVLIILLSLTFLSGYHVSILRAVGQRLLKELSIVSNEKYDSMSALAVLNILFLIYNPYYSVSISYQLSFIAAFSLAQDESWMQILKVYIGIFPILMTMDVSFNILTIPLNILIIAVMSGLLPMTALVAILPLNIDLLNRFVQIGYESIISVLDWLSNYTFLNIKLFYWNTPILAAYYFVFFIYFIIKENEELYNCFLNMKYWMAVFSVAFLFFVNSMTYRYFEEGIFFFDVGNGDSLLINDHKEKILIDAGSYIDVKNYLDVLGVKSLSAAFISHGHLDHYGGLKYLQQISIECLFINDDSVLKDMKLVYNHKVELIKNDLIDFKNIDIKVLSPENSSLVKDENDLSQVLWIKYNGIDLLTTGDISSDIEKNLQVKNMTLLKVSHHGSKTSSSEEFLKKINPAISVVSVGENNQYGHPHLEAIERLERYSGKVLRTDKVGTIMIKIKDDRLLYKFF